MVLNGVTLELTTRCNFSCIHCYQKNKTRSLDENLIFDIIDKAIQLGKGWLNFSGGEALLHPSFYKAYHRARYTGLPINLFTNGYLLESFLEKESLPPNFIEISVYGFSDKAYKIVTGRSAFSKIKSAIEYTIRKELNCKFKYVLMKQNVSDLGAFLEFCSQKKVQHSINPALLPTGAEFRLDPKILVELEKKYPGIYLFKEIENSHFCTIGEEIYVSADGNIRGCPAMPAYCPATIIEKASDFESIAKELKLNIDLKNHQFCPAWEMRESPQNIAKYSIKGFSNE